VESLRSVFLIRSSSKGRRRLWAPPLAACVQSDRKRNSKNKNAECRMSNVDL